MVLFKANNNKAMSIPINHPHDKFFKRNLKEKKIVIDFLKAYLPPGDLSVYRAGDFKAD